MQPFSLSRAGFSRGRRELLAGLAALGAGAFLKPARTAAQTPGEPYRVDIHHHLFPPEYRTAMSARGNNLVPWTPADSIGKMDDGAVETSYLSVSPPGVWFGDTEQARRLSRIVNEHGATLARDYPGRFGLFAALPLPDVEGSLREIEYAFETLGADGIGLMTSYGDRWLGDAFFAPIWEELNRRQAVVYTHPNTPACCGSLNTGVPVAAIEWATDTTRTAASLLFSGSAARYSNIRWILSHGGGTMPFLLSRFQNEEATMKGKSERLPRGLMHELRKFYYDTAQANHPGALAALLEIVPMSQILFGSDFPYRTFDEVNAGLAAHGFSAGDLRGIERDNAMGLFSDLV
jgi:predicted TIM-barrel fold metal-dependent hydrolase